MADVDKKTRTLRLQLTDAKAAAPLSWVKTGMPALDSIHDDKITIKPGKRGPSYRILQTTEVDGYEDNPSAAAFRAALTGQKMPAPKAIAAASMMAFSKTAPKTKGKGKVKGGGKGPAAGGAGAGPDDFAGTARREAKLSLAAASPAVNYSDVSALIASLPPVDQMAKLNISTAPNSNRVKQEDRNIHVKAFLYAASREADNDFHLIVGLDPKSTSEMYMTMEISGLPPANYPAYASLNAARTAYKQFFGSNLPGVGYHFYQPPIPVEITGSIFFDASHAIGQAPGPPSLKSRMPTIWEVHPIGSIRLGP